MKETLPSCSSKACEQRGAGANLIMFSLMWNSYLPDIPFASHHHIQMAGTLISFSPLGLPLNMKVFFPFFFSPPCESSDKNGSIITLLDKNEYKFYWKTTPATMWEKHTQQPLAHTTQCTHYEKWSPLKMSNYLFQMKRHDRPQINGCRTRIYTTFEPFAHSKGRGNTVLPVFAVGNQVCFKINWFGENLVLPVSSRPLRKLFYFSSPLRRGFHKLSRQLFPPA